MTVPVPGDAPLISRRVFFGNPDKASPQISPDGAWLSWLAPVDGVLNVWVAPAEKPAEARPVTRDTGRGVRLYSWTYPDEGHGFARPAKDHQRADQAGSPPFQTCVKPGLHNSRRDRECILTTFMSGATAIRSDKT